MRTPEKTKFEETGGCKALPRVISLSLQKTNLPTVPSIRGFRIEKTNDAVIVELEDVTVRFDGQVASVKVPLLYKSGLCGICGHYDGEKQYELRMADNELTDDLEQYSRSYFNNDEECDIEENIVKEKMNYRLEDDSNEFFGEDEDEEHTESNIKSKEFATH